MLRITTMQAKGKWTLVWLVLAGLIAGVGLTGAFAQGDSPGEKEYEEAQALLRQITGILGLQLKRSAAAGGQADEFVDLLTEVRDELRDQKLWALSDLIRDRLAELGVTLEDVKTGTTWRWK